MNTWITLPFDPYERGVQLGDMWRTPLALRVESSLERLRLAGISADHIARRVDELTRLLSRHAPAWLDEAAGIAGGAGISVHDVLLLNAVRIPDSPPSGLQSCSSFVWVRPERTLLFKIRDERPHPQVLYSYAGPLGEGQSVCVAKDIGNLGVAHATAARGIAGANNTGSHVADIAPDARFDDCHVLRFVVERAGSIDQVEPLLRELLDAGAIGGASPDRGSILLLADARGAAAVELTSTHIVVRRIDSGSVAYTNHFQTPEALARQTREPDANSRTRLARMAELLDRIRDGAEVSQTFSASRDRTHAPDCLCSDDSTRPWMTVSAQLHIVASGGPELTYACCGNTRNSVFIPVSPIGQQSHRRLLSGEIYALAERSYRAFGCGDHLASVQARIEGRYLDGDRPELATRPPAALETSGPDQGGRPPEHRDPVDEVTEELERVYESTR